MDINEKWALSGLRVGGPSPEAPGTLRGAIAKLLRLPQEAVGPIEVRKRSLDGRQRPPAWVFSLLVALPADFVKPDVPGHIQLKPHREEALVKALKQSPAGPRPVVIGAGPAGLFAALRLAELGWPPTLLERGKRVEDRGRDVNRFWRQGQLDEESNAIFGEGGSGTFSDGKIYTRKRDPRVRNFLEYLVRLGAKEDILTAARPHVGTDRLKVVLMNMRADLKDKGVDIRFGTQAVGMEHHNGRVLAIQLGSGERLEAGAVLVGPGHSARDTVHWLHRDGAEMEARPTAIGVRIEHPQEMIDHVQYGNRAAACELGAASYHLSWKPREPGQRAVFSFCMCPGGLVIAATAQADRVVTNGMSFSTRSARLANAGLIAQVTLDDYAPFGTADDPLRGFRYQDHYEQLAYQAGGGGYHAPAQLVADFLNKRPSEQDIHSSYRPGVTPSDLRECLPPPVVESLAAALPSFHRKLDGYAGPDAHMVGIESRTSSPVRIMRGADRQSTSVKGLYPIGEGAGYAGGIVSAAIDGMRSAEALIEKVKPRSLAGR